MARILVVEDEALIAEDIREALVRLDYDVVGTAASAREALALTDRERPDLVLMDIRIRGGTDGIETAAMLEKAHQVPVVFLTSHSDEATFARATRVAPYGYMLKPFEERDLRITVEIALQKHALERRIAERERWFSTTLQSIADAVIATDPNRTITFMNPVAERVTGWSSAEMVGQDIDAVMHLAAANGSRVENPLARAIATVETARVPPDTRIVRRDGSSGPIEDNAAPIVDDRGTLLGAVIVFRDVGERKGLEVRLAQAERLAALGTLAAGVGHEINNPMAAVVANVEYLREQLERLIPRLDAPSPDEAEARAHVRTKLRELAEVTDETSGASARVSRVVQDLRRFTRIQPNELAPVNLTDVVDFGLRMAQGEIRHRARVVRKYEETPLVLADEGALCQVVTNLIVNAAQAFEEEGAPRNEIAIATRTDDAGCAVIEVRDNGPGIPASVRPKIFDPFFTTKGVGQGMGLGLAISHHLVSVAGGELTVDTAQGLGTTFRIVLPPGRLAPSRPAPSKEPPSRRARVLIVDDEESVGRAMQRVLREEHDVTFVETGAEALALLTPDAAFDVVLCDVAMPAITGIDVYERVLATAPALARRIVFMTGGALTPKTDAFLQSTTQRTLAKPIVPVDLRALVREFVRDDA